MTDNATPKPKRRGYSRPTLYPARLAVMLTTEMRDELDALVEETGASLGEIARNLLADGLIYADVPPETRHDVSRLARDGGVSEAEAITTMLDFAARESERRVRAGKPRDITIEL